ncbi:MAG: hypothetical protein RJB38_2393 [Pseudomonadota bacterium]|jgi:hypothetical protein
MLGFYRGRQATTLRFLSKASLVLLAGVLGFAPLAHSTPPAGSSRDCSSIFKNKIAPSLPRARALPVLLEFDGSAVELRRLLELTVENQGAELSALLAYSPKEWQKSPDLLDRLKQRLGATLDLLELISPPGTWEGETERKIARYRERIRFPSADQLPLSSEDWRDFSKTLQNWNIAEIQQSFQSFSPKQISLRIRAHQEQLSALLSQGSRTLDSLPQAIRSLETLESFFWVLARSSLQNRSSTPEDFMRIFLFAKQTKKQLEADLRKKVPAEIDGDLKAALVLLRSLKIDVH